MSDTPDRSERESPANHRRSGRRRRGELRTSRLADGSWLVVSRPERAPLSARGLEDRSHDDPERGE